MKNAGTYAIESISSTVDKEWADFCTRRPDDAVRAYERLTTDPRTPVGGRQFPLRGKALKGFWQYECNGGDRLHYKVIEKTVRVYSIGNHPSSNPAMQKTLIARDR